MGTGHITGALARRALRALPALRGRALRRRPRRHIAQAGRVATRWIRAAGGRAATAGPGGRAPGAAIFAPGRRRARAPDRHRHRHRATCAGQQGTGYSPGFAFAALFGPPGIFAQAIYLLFCFWPLFRRGAHRPIFQLFHLSQANFGRARIGAVAVDWGPGRGTGPGRAGPGDWAKSGTVC